MTTQALCLNCNQATKVNSTLLCSHDANPVTGEPRHFCNTQRLVGTKDEAKAIQAAELIGFCGPNARFYEAREDVRMTFFKRVSKSKDVIPMAVARA